MRILAKSTGTTRSVYFRTASVVSWLYTDSSSHVVGIILCEVWKGRLRWRLPGSGRQRRMPVKVRLSRGLAWAGRVLLSSPVIDGCRGESSMFCMRFGTSKFICMVAPPLRRAMLWTPLSASYAVGSCSFALPFSPPLSALHRCSKVLRLCFHSVFVCAPTPQPEEGPPRIDLCLCSHFSFLLSSC